MSKIKSEFHHFPKRKVSAILVIFILTIVGVRLLTLSHAQSAYASVQAESGSLSSGATITNDSSASNGAAVQFDSSGIGACTNSLNGSSVVSLDGGAYHLQADEWDSSAAFGVCNDSGEDFTISSSSIDNATNGPPGAYPSLYKGCHWGNCTTNSGMPVAVSTMTGTPNTVTTSYDTSIITGNWDDSYDIWFNPATSTSSNSSGLEMMIWLNHQGGVQPIGSIVASGVTIGGIKYNVWYGGTGYGTVSYEMTSTVTSVSNLDIGLLAADAVSRGYMQNSWYLLDVEAGFETWIGGQGLTANSFSVNVQ